jgi:hypothetical protein
VVQVTDLVQLQHLLHTATQSAPRIWRGQHSNKWMNSVQCKYKQEDTNIIQIILKVGPTILQYSLQKDQQMLKKAVDVLLIHSKFSTPTCFGIWLPSSGGRQCLISYSSNVLVLDMCTRPKHRTLLE